MRLIELRTRGFLRVRAVDIRPARGVTPIKGENESGKTSTLDSLWVALKGKAVLPAEPINDGAEKCTIQATLGDQKAELVITRTFSREPGGAEITQTLDVRTGEGVKITKSPQATLDALCGQLGFDPLLFERAEPKKQFDMLRTLVPGIDFDDIAAKRATAYAERTVSNRQAGDAAATAARTFVPEGPKPKPIDVAAALTALQNAGRVNAEIQTARNDFQRLQREAEAKEDEAERVRARAATLDREAKELKEQAMSLHVVTTREPVDETALREKIAEADKVKGIIANFEARQQWLDVAEQHQGKAAKLTTTIEALDKQKADAIAAAKLPVDGLSLGDGEVTYNGHPFANASAAVQMKVSVAVAMALNPSLKVILVRDGSLLDKKSLTMLAKLAEEKGFDVLLETVDTDMPGGFEIVDGANAP